MPEKNMELHPTKRALIALREMRAKLEAMEKARSEPIAIIGMACRFPGHSHSIAEFWHLLRSGVDAITPVPAERWDVERYYDSNPDTPGKMYTREGGFIDDVDKFDPKFFGISPREAIRIDPQQRFLMEVTWEALESAGISPAGLVGSSTGVFVGISTSDYAQMQIQQNDPDQIDAYFGTGGSASIAAGRLSYVLGLRGPTLALDTTCSSSLVAVDLAVQHLRSGRCNLSLAGGVNLMLSPEASIILSKVKALSPEGRCKTFDASADGYGRGEGCGVVVLKRLSDAEADGDNIMAVIRGSAVNHDGRSSGITVPNLLAQEEVIRQALADAKTEPLEVSYVEAHGTGTALGDPIELRALDAVLCQGRHENQKLIVGSVKTNIGHLEAAAGVGSLIKAVLALQHGEIPPHLHFENPSPYIPWENIAISIPKELIPWSKGEGPRTAGVSSFGFSGTNAHIIVQEAPIREHKSADFERPSHLLTLSAKSESALDRLVGRYLAHTESNTLEPSGDVCFTANAGRSHFGFRLAVAGDSLSQIRDGLKLFSSGKESARIVKGHVPETGQRVKIAFLFTGQGAQYANMGRDLYHTQPTFRKAIDQCDELLRLYVQWSLVETLYPKQGMEVEKEKLLNETAFTQPALFAFEYALAKLWLSWGVEPSAVMGHSIGEYVAACIAGVFSLRDGLKLTANRGRLMQSLPAGGLMVAVFADEGRVTEAIRAYDGRVSIAALNGPENTVISGEGAAVQAITETLEADGIECRPLTVSHAFHSPLIEPILAEFERTAAQISYAKPRTKLICNLTGESANADEIVQAARWRRHAREPVRFSKSIHALHKQGFRTFLEIGPHPVLLGMGARCLSNDGVTWLPSLRKGQKDWQQMLESLSELYVRGFEVDWKSFDRDYSRHKIALPTYPFDRERYWFPETEPDGKANNIERIASKTQVHPLLGERVRSPLIQDTIFTSSISVDTMPSLKDHVVFGMFVFPMSGHLETALAAVCAASESMPYVLEDIVFEEPLTLHNRDSVMLQFILPPRTEGASMFRIYSTDADEADRDNAWTLHTVGRIRFDEKGEANAWDTDPGTLEDYRKACTKELDGKSFYAQMGEHGVDLGPTFRTVEKVWLGGGEVLGRLRLPDSIVDKDVGYQIHPAMLNGCFQLVEAGLPSSGSDSGSDYTYLPVGIGKLSIRGGMGSACWGHARIHEGDGDKEIISADICVFNDNGDAVVRIDRYVAKRFTRNTLRKATKMWLQDWLYEIQWEWNDHEPVDPPTVNDSETNWLIFADRTGVGASLATILEARGQTCRLIFAGEEFEKSEAGDFRVNPSHPEDFENLLREIATNTEWGVRGVVHLWSLDVASPEQLNRASFDENLALSSGSVLHLVQALSSASGKVARLWLVTRGAQTVETDSLPSAVGQAPLWGLGRVVALEHPEMWGGMVDLDPAGSANEVSMLFQKIKNSGSEDSLAFRRDQRYVARLVHSKGRMSLEPVILKPDATYLITGGLGGLGIEVARWMAGKGARNLALVGRSGASDRAAEAIDQLERSGTKIVIYKGDVSREEDVGRILADVSQHMPLLRGIVHTAAVLDDGLLHRLDWSRFVRAFAPKAKGAWNIHVLTRHMPLDFFVLFSSAETLFGSPGQGNYVAANAFLDSLAHYRKAQGLPALSINWGPWADVGMVAARDLGGKIAMHGMDLIEPQQGLRLLEEVLQRKVVQVAVLPINWKQFRRFSSSAGLPILKDLIAVEVNDKPHSGSAPRDTMTRQKLLAASGPERSGLLESYLCEQVAAVLRMSDSTPDPRELLTALGLDSLMAVELRNRIQADFGVAIPLDILLQDATICQIAEQLMNELTGPGSLGIDHVGLIEPDADKSWEVMEL